MKGNYDDDDDDYHDHDQDVDDDVRNEDYDYKRNVVINACCDLGAVQPLTYVTLMQQRNSGSITINEIPCKVISKKGVEYLQIHL
jgi:hypothetical protein